MSVTPTAEDFVRGYGPNFRRGVIFEHLTAFVVAGGVVRTSASGETLWALVPTGRAFTAYRVLCSEVVAIDTEDGPMSARCGRDATDEGCCEGHAEIIAGWRAQSEAEIIAWERDREWAS